MDYAICLKILNQVIVRKMSDAWSEINPPIMSSKPHRDRKVLDRARDAKKHADWALIFAREGNIERAEKALRQAKQACED